MGQSRSARQGRLSRVLGFPQKNGFVIVLVGLVGTLASLTLWRVMTNSERRGLEDRFAVVADELALSIESTFVADTNVLYSMKAFFAGSRHVDSDEFAVFAEPLIERHRHIRALEWLPRIRHAERSVYERDLSQQTLQTVRIYGMDGEAREDGDEYYPVTFAVQLETGGESAWGADHASDPVRWNAMQRAMNTGSPAATERVNLWPYTSVSGQAAGATIYMPVYSRGERVDTARHRRRNLTGFLAAQVSVSAMADSLAPQEVDFVWLDMFAAAGKRILHVHAPRGRIGNASPEYVLHSASLRRVHSLELPGREWRMVATPTESYLAQGRTGTPALCLAGGLLITLILSAYLTTLSGRTAEVERVVVQRTAELQAANERLNQEVLERKAAEERLSEHARRVELANQHLEDARRELKQTVDELEDRNRELDEFTYVASHDLQEPVRKLVSFSRLLEQDLGEDLNERASQDLNYIVDAAQRMRSLIQALLSLSRAGRGAMEQEVVSLDECVDRALDALALRIEETSASVIREEPLPKVVGDATLLTQLFQNLIGNALKFSGDEPPMVGLTAERSGDEVAVCVADNGIGLNPDFADRIFQPFQRLHSRSEYAGTGIGLAICRKTVHRHGGRIWVESSPGEGSRFYFTIKSNSVVEDETCRRETQTQPALSSC